MVKRVLVSGWILLLLVGCDPALVGLNDGEGPAPLTVASFSPTSGYQGTLIHIEGSGFAEKQTVNKVRIGNVDAIVVESTPTSIDAIVGLNATSGTVEVTVNDETITAADAFTLAPWPGPGSAEDGPPMFYKGAGAGVLKDLPSTGTIKVLVVPGYPTDLVPANQVAVRQAIAAAWVEVDKFYRQASYGRLNIQVSVAEWVPLTGLFDDYVQLKSPPPVPADEPWWTPNLRPDTIERFRAELINDAVNSQDYDINQYDAVATYMFTDNQPIRAWGGSKGSNFAYNDGADIDINITADHELFLMSLGETANWGRCAHELGHCLVDSTNPAKLMGEDVYGSDLVDSSSATAESFDMMGAHDSHPLFSGYYMHQLGWFSDANVIGGDDDAPLQWDRNPFSAEFVLAAHGVDEDDSAERKHLIRIRVAEGLYYFVEVRQRPQPDSGQVFDTGIPINGAFMDGGVVVTKVITGELHNNQEMRFITLMHESRVLQQGEFATDPARALKISVPTVYFETLEHQRLICVVRVEWAQDMQPDPTADFDIRIKPWQGRYESPDIWIDRKDWNVFDFTDDSGNPVGNGDKPLVGQINRFWTRVHADGLDANNVRLQYYALTRPSIGDNGNWTALPASPKLLAFIGAAAAVEDYINWVPVVGEHTCLQVIAEPQLGEITHANNKAQENVFEFETVAASVPPPKRIALSVRNPENTAQLVMLTATGVPEGYMVALPHRWVYLEALGEKRIEAIVISLEEATPSQPFFMDLKVSGYLPRSYNELVDGVVPASYFSSIGGILAQIRPKHRVTLSIAEDEQAGNASTIVVKGTIVPAYADQPVEVYMKDPLGRMRTEVVPTDGAGAYTAAFDIGHAPTDDDSLGASEPPRVGSYYAKAYIVHASQAAETETEQILITRP
jgi:hypothetical protein